VLVPVLGWYAAQGALGPMLGDVVQYPRYMLAGYAKLPFPSLVASLPLRLAMLQDPDFLLLRLGYSAPFVCAAALLIAVPVAALSLRHPLVWLRETAESPGIPFVSPPRCWLSSACSRSAARSGAATCSTS
jgi:hypothetical protein